MPTITWERKRREANYTAEELADLRDRLLESVIELDEKIGSLAQVHVVRADGSREMLAQFPHVNGKVLHVQLVGQFASDLKRRHGVGDDEEIEVHHQGSEHFLETKR